MVNVTLWRTGSFAVLCFGVGLAVELNTQVLRVMRQSEGCVTGFGSSRIETSLGNQELSVALKNLLHSETTQERTLVIGVCDVILAAESSSGSIGSDRFLIAVLFLDLDQPRHRKSGTFGIRSSFIATLFLSSDWQRNQSSGSFNTQEEINRRLVSRFRLAVQSKVWFYQQ
jgi:hypothetical protein